MTLRPRSLKQSFLWLVFWSQELRKGLVSWSWKTDGVSTISQYLRPLLGTGLSTRLCVCILSCMVGSEYLFLYGTYFPLAQALQEKQMEATWPFLAEH